jgi:hypothetical protein
MTVPQPLITYKARGKSFIGGNFYGRIHSADTIVFCPNLLQPPCTAIANSLVYLKYDDRPKAKYAISSHS